MIDVERALVAARVDWPEADLSESVVRAVDDRPSVRRAPRLAWAAAAALVVMAFIVGTPAGRGVLANVLEVAGITIAWGEVTPGANLDLGAEVSLDEVDVMVGFELRIPVDEPDAVFVDSGVVHMTWEGGDTLPAATDTDVAVLYSQFMGTVFTQGTKTVGPDSSVTPLRVRGQEALWIEGAPHAVELAGQPVRLAANVLLWEESGVAHRIETTGDLDSAVELAG